MISKTRHARIWSKTPKNVESHYKTSWKFNKVYKNVKYCKQDVDQTDISPIFWQCHPTQQRLTYKVQVPPPPPIHTSVKRTLTVSVWVLCLQAPGDGFTDTSLSPDVSQKIGTITDPKNNVPGSTLWHWESFASIADIGLFEAPSRYQRWKQFYAQKFL